jgi:hypothetical protein
MKTNAMYGLQIGTYRPVLSQLPSLDAVFAIVGTFSIQVSDSSFCQALAGEREAQR